jgi:predicted nuclease with TOPRIM domain
MEPWVAAVSALGGGVLVALVGRLWPSKDVALQTQQTAEASFRDDLMQTVKGLQARVDKLEEELKQSQRESTALQAAYLALQHEHNALKAKYEDLRLVCEAAGMQMTRRGGE